MPQAPFNLYISTGKRVKHSVKACIWTYPFARHYDRLYTYIIKSSSSDDTLLIRLPVASYPRFPTGTSLCRARDSCAVGELYPWNCILCIYWNCWGSDQVCCTAKPLLDITPQNNYLFTIYGRLTLLTLEVGCIIIKLRDSIDHSFRAGSIGLLYCCRWFHLDIYMYVYGRLG